MRGLIMKQPPSTIPLTFALALAASLSEAPALAPPNPAESFTAGSLAPLVGDAADVNAQPQSRASRIAQWFNNTWFNCYSGNWRRC